MNTKTTRPRFADSLPLLKGRLVGAIPGTFVLGLWLLALLYLSSNRIFWCDEILLVSLIQAVPLADIVPALRDGADGGFPLAYWIFKIWPLTPGPMELGLRVPAVLSGLIAACGVYLGCRTYLGRPAAWLCVVVGTFGSTMLLRHASEVRFYGFLYAAAIMLWAALVRMRKYGEGERSAAFWLWFALTCALNTALVFSHQFGVLYSLIFGGFAILGMRGKSLRGLLRSLGPFVLGWVLLLFYLPVAAAQRTALLGGERLYDAPSVASLAKVYLQLLPGFSYEGRAWDEWHERFSVGLTVLLWFLAVLLLWKALRAGNKAATAFWRANTGADVALAGALLVLPFVIWIAGWLGGSFFQIRYLVVSQLGFVILFSLILKSLTPTIISKRMMIAAGAGILAWSALGLAGVPSRANQIENTFPLPPASHPVLSFRLSEFYHHRYYQPWREIYYFWDDGWVRANKPIYAYALVDFNIQAVRRKLGMMDGIVRGDELAALGDSFVVSAFNQATLDYLRGGVPGFELVSEPTAGGDVPVLRKRKRP